jgi:predicted ferric reductase
MWLRAKYEPFIYDIEPGVAGNILIWLIEFGITFFYALKSIKRAICVCRVEAVPSQVTEFALHHISEGHDEPYIQQELAKRGWTKSEDQTKAFLAAESLASLIKEEEEEAEEKQ